MNRTHLARLGLLVATCLLMLVFLEVAIRQVFPVPSTWLDPQATHLESPLLGWVLPPGLQAYTIDAPVSVNALGYRDDEMPREKPPGEYRVLALGDSFTFALGVRFEDLWVQQLERALAGKLGDRRPVQVVNAGVAGYNTRQELILLESEGWTLDPDLIVVGFYWNDLVGNETPLPDIESTPKIHPDGLTWERGERAQDHLIPAFIRDRLRQSVLLYQVTTRVKQLLSILRGENEGEYSRVQRALLAGDDETLAPYWEATRARLLAIARSARQHGVPVVLLVFPMENEIRHRFPDMHMSRTLKEIWDPTGMPFVDVGPAYRRALESGENPFLPYDLHPNRVGMRIAAEHVLTAIERQGYLDSGAEEDHSARPDADADAS